MAHQYLARDLPAEPGSLVVLDAAESRHAATVARLRLGEEVQLSNGKGLQASAVTVAVAPRRVELKVIELTQLHDPRPELWLVQALAKGGRDELAVQAATELGASVIIPWAANRSVSKWDADKAHKGRERWQSIADEASKQSLRAFIPEVRALHQSAELCGLDAQLLLLVPGASASLLDVRPSEDLRPLALVVGPEGGLAPEEIASLESAGARSVRLGREVLRTSTAGPAALAVLNAQLGRWA